MKNIKLTESDLLKIVKRIINEQPLVTTTTTVGRLVTTTTTQNKGTAIRKTIALNCTKRTADGMGMTSQQIGKWCPVTVTTTTISQNR
jgi:hypothetical protein